MGRDCGFRFYRFDGKKLVEANIVPKDYGNNEFCNYLNIHGRCKATSIFVDPIYSFYEECRKSKKECSPCLLLNHQEYEGIEIPTGDDWCKKLFYMSFEKFKSLFDFDEAQRVHNDIICNIEKTISDLKLEIENLRVHQEKAKTKVAFDCFEEKIQELKEKIKDEEEYLIDTIEDDYDYSHYMWIKEYFERTEEIIKNNPDIVVVAYASD